MDRGANQHLSATELAELAEAVRQRGPSIPRAEDVDPHLAVCPACRDQFLLHLQLEKLKSSKPALEQPDCPEAGLWQEIAARVAPPEQALAHIQHASRCDHCGPLLKEAVAEVAALNQPATEAERAQIALLASAQPEWQREIAERMACATRVDSPSASWWKGRASVPRLAMAGAALAAVVAAASWLAFHSRDSDSAGQLLARAYTEQRTLEVRFKGAGYAPLRLQRGPQASFADRNPSLLKAEALIASQLPSHPSDPSWLQAKARADLLEGKYDAAVESLRRALELSPDSPDLMVDLGSAYFQRAQTEDRPLDYGAAFEYLSKVLAQHPDDPVALFNRAIISEHQFLYHQALDDWEHYLRVDARSDWANEARSHADAVRSKLKQHESANRPLLSPAEIAASATLPADLDERVEQYLDAALQRWLPEAYPETNATADPHARQALFLLANLTRQQHKDRWLSDLLNGSSAPAFPQAVASLSRVARANKSADFDVSRKEALRAEPLFRASRNRAGVLRAQFEEIFALRNIRQSETCRRQASASLAESEKYSYPWLQVQLGLEKGICSELMGDIGTDRRAARLAMELAEKNCYGSLYLRALNFAAGDQLAIGDQAGTGKLASAGLGRYWSGELPAMRGYGLYTELAYSAEAAGWPNLQVAIWREAITLIDTDGDLLYRAMAHQSMANTASAAHQPHVAELQFAEAARLFSLAPRNEASSSAALENEIQTAQLEERQGQFDGAIARLTRIQGQIRQVSNNYLVQIFYSTLGELQLGRHREAEAEQALRPALALAEQSLATLRSEAERTSWSKGAAPAYLALIEAELVQGRSQEALETYEWYRGAPQRVPPDPRPHLFLTNPPMPDPSRMPSRLPLLAKQTVLAYAVLPDGLAIWVCDDRGINARWIPKPTDGLQELAERFHDLSSDPKSEMSALHRDARSLYGVLIAPVEQYLAPGRTLVIEAEGWLARVPFEALLDSNDHYLVEGAPIVYSLGQDSQARLRTDTGISADSPALVVGSTASSPADGLIPLPDVAAEADTVASGFHSARELKGREAALSAVRSELPGAAVFHFAGHSLATPERTGLMLEDGDGQATAPRLMDAAGVRQLRLQGLQLAVLSACSTASGSGGSSGFNSVTEALLRAGVPHVVASRWAVDSTETRGFVEDFYHNALSGQTVSDAIRLTSRKMLANPRTAHPYYWSAFLAYGRP
ncbi:MAG: CHAT domain-containing protein [Acidobacteriia bacterium]|nr:CHAT domain-containing protein [Terriglobia bacterium]